MKRLVAIILATMLGAAQAATHYIRDGGSASTSGTGSCTGWATANACDQLPDTLVRGDTYCVADGSYSGREFTTATSGTSVITIKKAVDGDGSCDQGANWTSTYGDGQAAFTEMIFTTGYFTVNGVTRNESSWNTSSAYGFFTTGVSCNRLSFGACGDNITIQYMAISCGDPDCGRPIYVGGFSGGSTGAENWTVSHSYIYNSGEINVPGGDGFTYEYNYHYQTYGKECIRGQVSAVNMTVRYNVFHDCCRDDNNPGGGCTAEVALFRNQGDSDIDEFEGFKFYGNIIRKTISQHKTDASVAAQAADCKIYNNTIYDDSDTGTSSLLCETGAGSVIQNNILYLPNGMTAGFTAATANNNSTYTSSPPFVNVSTGDFHLTGALAGASLSSPYNVDVEGNTRGADGTFDRGAYEYDEGGSVPNAPQNLRLISWLGTLLGLGFLLGGFNAYRNRGGWGGGAVARRPTSRSAVDRVGERQTAQVAAG